VSGVVRPAAAEEREAQVAAVAEKASRTPLAPRVLHVPTAWLQSPGRVYGSTGLDHRGGGFFAIAGGLGRLAEIDVNITDRFVRCAANCQGDERSTSAAWVASALFKIGAGADALFAGQPALALGFRKSFYVTEAAASSTEKPVLAELYAAASRRVGPLGLHVGAQLFDASTDSARLLDTGNPARRIRPFAGLEWTPPIYPRTTVLADLSWVPEFRRGDDGEYDVELRWLGGWGIRYQALSWGSIELGVRHREGEGLSDSTVFVRVNGTTDLRSLPKLAAGLRKTSN
jgi:hypothetical protein